MKSASPSRFIRCSLWYFIFMALMPLFCFGGVSGQVLVEGEFPAPKPINFGAERQCAAMHEAEPVFSEDIVVNSNNTLKWVFVYIKEDIPGDYAVPAEPVIVDQQGCIFSPHVAGVRKGQAVEFRNSDALLHNVRAVSKEGQNFNIAQPIQGMKTKKIFEKPELGIELRCDVHYWMKTYLHVMNHPYYAITGDDGNFDIEGVPDGSYTLEAWHEKLGTQSLTVTVSGGQAEPVTFTFKAQ